MRSERGALIAWAFLAPALIYVLAIVAWPLVQTVILSFTDASLRKTMNWVGWVNYDKIFNATFATVIARTFVWTFFSVLLKMILGTIGAVLLNAADVPYDYDDPDHWRLPPDTDRIPFSLTSRP